MSLTQRSWMSLVSRAPLAFLCFIPLIHAAANLTTSAHIPETVPIISCANVENIFGECVSGCSSLWEKIADLPRVCPNDPAIDCAGLPSSSVWRRINGYLASGTSWKTAYDLRESFFTSNFCFYDPAWLPVGGWATPRWTKIEGDTGNRISIEYEVVSGDYCSMPPCKL
jgi:hypothetical protein